MPQLVCCAWSATVDLRHLFSNTSWRLHPGLSHHCVYWLDKGLSFEERRIVPVRHEAVQLCVGWAGIVVAVSTLILRCARARLFHQNPRVSITPHCEVLMSGLIIAFCSVQISLVLHNETLMQRCAAHLFQSKKMPVVSLGFLVICGIHFYGIMACDAILRGASPIDWACCCCGNSSFACLEVFVTGGCWASWVLPVSAMRNKENSAREMDSILTKQVARRRT